MRRKREITPGAAANATQECGASVRSRGDSGFPVGSRPAKIKAWPGRGCGDVASFYGLVRGPGRAGRSGLVGLEAAGEDGGAARPRTRRRGPLVGGGPLREPAHVINRGVDLYQAGEINSCYRLFEGSLRTVKPLLAHRSGLAKDIESALANVEKDPVIWRRAFALRAVLDKIRKEIKPPPPVRPPPVEKPPVEKPPEKKPEPGLLKAPRPLEEEKAPEAPDRFGLLKMPRLLEG